MVAIATLYALGSCNNGAYVANPNTNGNNSANPLDPLDSSGFSWGGESAISFKVNGNYIRIDSTLAGYGFDDTILLYNIVGGYSGGKGIYLYLNEIYRGNTYNFGFGNFQRLGVYYDSTKAYSSLYGNVGQVYIIRSDAERFKGKFYFQASDTFGRNVVNITEGYFDIKK